MVHSTTESSPGPRHAPHVSQATRIYSSTRMSPSSFSMEHWTTEWSCAGFSTTMVNTWITTPRARPVIHVSGTSPPPVQPMASP